jgi:DNA-binding NtrC family response regulator
MADELEQGSLPVVMVVDDDEDVREILGQTLMKNRYKVQLCESGMEAITSITPQTRVVILDMMMPDMDGTETYLELQKKVPGVPVVFYSAYRTLLDQKKLGSFKPIGFVEKGATGSKQYLLDLVRKTCEQPS